MKTEEKFKRGPSRHTPCTMHGAGVTNGICVVLQGIHHGTVSFKGMFAR